MPVSDFALVTLQQVKDFLKISGSSTSRDNYLIAEINRVSRQIEQKTKRRIVARDYEEDINGNGTRKLFMDNYPILNIATLIDNHGDPDIGFTAADVIAQEDRTFDKDTGAVILWNNEGVFSRNRQNVRIHYHAGFALLDVEWSSNKFEFRERASGTVYTVQIKPDVHDVFSLASQIQVSMSSLGLNSYAVDYDTKNRKYIVRSTTTTTQTLQLIATTATVTSAPLLPTLGFGTTATIFSGATRYTPATAVIPRVPYDLQDVALNIVALRYDNSSYGSERRGVKSERIGNYSVSFFGTTITEETNSIIESYTVHWM